MAEAERVDAGGPVERRGDRRPPVDDDRIVGVVLDVAAADVPAVGVLVGDPPEEVAGTRAAQVLQRLGDGDLDVLRGDLVGRRRRVDRAGTAGSSRRGSRGRSARWSRSASSSGNRSACTGSVTLAAAARRIAVLGNYARAMETEQIVEPAAAADAEIGDEVVEEELLIEEISIDGMCGVY